MIAELKDRSQVTIPKRVVNELGLKIGDQFEVVTHKGEIHLVPVVVYPKTKLKELETLAAKARESLKKGTFEVFDDPGELVVSLHAGA
jgi:AbrB family looped-hinge helix DNA binding protein